jgi:hypothetical protein
MVDMFRTGDTAGAVEVSLFHLEDTVQVARSSALLREDAVALTE